MVPHLIQPQMAILMSSYFGLGGVAGCGLVVPCFQNVAVNVLSLYAERPLRQLTTLSHDRHTL